MDFKLSDFKDFLKYDPSSESIKGGAGEEKNEYYARVSYRYSYAKKLACLALALVIIIFLLMGSITYDSFYYLAKDFVAANDYVNADYESISYPSGEAQSFAIYREGLAVASREGISIYSAMGRELYSASHQYGNPVLKTSSKYALLYDSGGKKYSIYNSFSKIDEKSLDYCVYDAEMADNGEYVIVTGSADYTSIAQVYDNGGRRYDYSFKSSYIAAIDISENGKQLAIALIDTEGDAISCEIRSYRVGEDSYNSARTTFRGIPYDIAFLSNGNICAVGERGINVFDGSLKLKGELEIDSTISSYSVSDEKIAVALYDGELKTKIIIIDKNGDISYNNIISERVLDISTEQEYLFIQIPDGFIRIDTYGKDCDQQRIKTVSSGFRMLVFDKDRLLICNGSYARFIDF